MYFLQKYYSGKNIFYALKITKEINEGRFDPIL